MKTKTLLSQIDLSGPVSFGKTLFNFGAVVLQHHLYIFGMVPI